MKERLEILERDYVFCIGWYLPDEDDFGATLGERTLGKEPDRATAPDDWEMWMATKTAQETLDVRQDLDGLFWETNSEAQKALVLIRATLRSPRPLVDWEQKALAAGWKPPRKL